MPSGERPAPEHAEHAIHKRSTLRQRSHVVATTSRLLSTNLISPAAKSSPMLQRSHSACSKKKTKNPICSLTQGTNTSANDNRAELAGARTRDAAVQAEGRDVHAPLEWSERSTSSRDGGMAAASRASSARHRGKAQKRLREVTWWMSGRLLHIYIVREQESKFPPLSLVKQFIGFLFWN